jgi:hypothetical protein
MKDELLDRLVPVMLLANVLAFVVILAGIAGVLAV